MMEIRLVAASSASNKGANRDIVLTEEKTHNPARFTKFAYSKPKNGRFIYRTNGHLVREPDIQATSQRRAAANGSFVRILLKNDVLLAQKVGV